MKPYELGTLPVGINSKFVPSVNGLTFHILETGGTCGDRPVILLLHGFPEIAYSWRKIMVPLAREGYRVISPDQRGFGRTTGWRDSYSDDLTPFGMLNLTRDIIALIHAMEIKTVDVLIGHDFGASVASYATLVRPDIFRSLVLMSAPFEGPPNFPFGSTQTVENINIDAELASLDRPRKHYHHYYSTADANGDLMACPQGVTEFLRGYFHAKSADWSGNDPFPLNSWAATELARMPTYYIMDREASMAEIANSFMPSKETAVRCTWLTNAELEVYGREFLRTGFQGGLNWYRCRFNEKLMNELRLLSRRTIDVPSCFISGEKDWGVYQRPGAVEIMREKACTNMKDIHLIPMAGHWVQQEQPEEVVGLIKLFISQN